MLILLGLLLAGFVIGVSDAVVGGGNLLLLSVLSLLGLSPLHAVATMQVTSFVQTIATTAVYTYKRLINWKEAFFAAPFAFIGGFVGAEIAILVPERTLAIIGGIMMLVVLFLIPQIKSRKLSFPMRFFNFLTKTLHTRKHAISKEAVRYTVLAVLSFIVGIYGGFYGGGVGTLLLLLFFFIGKDTIMRTAGTTKAVNFFLSISAVYVFLNADKLVQWEYSLPLMFGTVVGSYFGVKWGEDYGHKYVQLLLYTVVGSAIVKLLFF